MNSGKRVPKRLVYCSDGVLEEFSSSESEDEIDYSKNPDVDPQTMSWGQWALHYAHSSISSSAKMAEYFGGRIADFMGITTPVYQYEIDEYYRMKEQEKVKKIEEADECRTRSKEHAMVSASQPYCIAMSNDRTNLNSTPQSAETPMASAKKTSKRY